MATPRMLGSSRLALAALLVLGSLLALGRADLLASGAPDGASSDDSAAPAVVFVSPPAPAVVQWDHSLLALSRGALVRQGGSRQHALARLGGPGQVQPREHLGHVLAAVQKLAQGVTNGTEQLSDVSREALAGIGEEMQAIIAGTDVSHAEDQGEVDRARDAVAECSEVAGGDTDASAAVAANEQEHESCRGEEAELSRNKSTVCAANAAALAAPGAPECMLTFSGAQSSEEAEHLESCLALIAAWLTPYQARIVEAKASCEGIQERHQAKTQNCSILQRGFEESFCGYRREVMGTCSRDNTCFSSRTAAQVAVHEKVQVSESSRKKQFVAASHIQCYLKVLNGSAEAQPDLLGGCSFLEVATSHLDVTYHAAAMAAECDVTVVATYPCQQPWLAEHYEKKPWFADAPAEACAPCGDGASPAPAEPTEDPSPNAAVTTAAPASTTASPMPSSSGLPLTRQAYDEGKLILNDYKGDTNPSVVTFSEQAGFTQTYHYLAWGFTAAAWAEAGLTDWNGDWMVQFHFMYTSQTSFYEGFYISLDDDTNCGQETGSVQAIFFDDGRGAMQNWRRPGHYELSTTSSAAEVVTAVKQRDTPMYWEVAHVAGGGVTFKLFKESSGELLLEAATSGSYEVVTFRDEPVVPIAIYHKTYPVVFSGVKVKEAASAA